jgi:transketolase
MLPEGVPLLAIEAGVTLGWDSYLGLPMSVLGVDRFGASAPGEIVMREYGFSVENVWRLCRSRHNRHNADHRLMPTRLAG